LKGTRLSRKESDTLIIAHYIFWHLSKKKLINNNNNNNNNNNKQAANFMCSKQGFNEAGMKLEYFTYENSMSFRNFLLYEL